MITYNRDTGLAYIQESVTLPNYNIPRRNILHLTEALSSHDLPQIIFPKFNILHAETITRNRTYYFRDTLEVGANTMLRPYRIPFLQNHDTYSSETFGRALQATMVNEALNNTWALQGIFGIAHPEAIQQILNGNWSTVSLGSRTEKALCGICKADLTQDPCEHDMDNPDFFVQICKEGFETREVSRVNVPSDPLGRCVDKNVDPQEIALYAADATHESVYDLCDARRINLLESASETEQTTINALWGHTQWLVKEFAAPRKHYFMMQEAARAAAKETSLLITIEHLLSRAAVRELPEDAFGLSYTEERTKKSYGRFPMAAEFTDKQRAYVGQQITQAKDITPEMRDALLARNVASAGTDPLVPTVQIVINESNYACLLDVLDEMDTELDVWETLARTPVQEAEVVVEPVVETVVVPEVPVTEPTPAASDEMELLLATLETERLARKVLLSETIARQQIALGERITKGQTQESLCTLYQSKDISVLETLFELLKPTFDQLVVDVTNIETVENPLSGILSADTLPVLEPGIAETPVPVTNETVTPTFSPLSYFGVGAYSAASKQTAAVQDALQTL